jgi:hypothetical protein
VIVWRPLDRRLKDIAYFTMRIFAHSHAAETTLETRRENGNWLEQQNSCGETQRKRKRNNAMPVAMLACCVRYCYFAVVLA